ncbi:MAG: TetR/AcrR family transcriptional regulator [Ruminococcus sp.]|nr:TetR/AcrR family transcriptional regulator [Ruminococcus sp.]
MSDKDTRERLLNAAKAEFSKKGYSKASLRKICSDAGVTTGALYFFFKDKEDLFAQIVEPPLETLKETVLSHFYKHEMLASPEQLYTHVEGDHDDISGGLIRLLYSNYDAFLLLLTGAQGSRFENAVDETADMLDKAYRMMAEKIAENSRGMRVNPYMLHWFTHMNIEAFVHLITHEPDEKKAGENMKKIMDFLVKGWTQMILEPEGESAE